jgi:cytidine deaminase
MEEHLYQFKYKMLSLSELDKQDQALILCAIKSREQAYAPYSSFWVGAALLLSNGVVITGNNQENAAYPSGLCAERTALFYAKANYPKEKILKIAICGDNSSAPQGEITTPCGNCRQALLEYECTQGSPITVFCASTQGKVLEIDSIKNLLPFCFELLYKPS